MKRIILSLLLTLSLTLSLLPAVNAAGITGEEKHAFFIPKLMSRKKQIIPALSALWG